MQLFRPVLQKTCPICGTPFETRKEKQLYCRPACRYRAYQETHVQISLEEWRQFQTLKELAASAGLIGWRAADGTGVA